MDDEVDEAVLLEELTALEAFGELDLDRVGDRSLLVVTIGCFREES